MKIIMKHPIYLFLGCLILYTLLDTNKISAELSDGCPRKGKEKEPEVQPSYESDNAKREVNEPNYEDLDSLEMDDAMEETPNNNVDIQADSDNGSPQANIEEDVNSNQEKNNEDQAAQQNDKQSEKNEESEDKDANDEMSKYEGVFGGLPEDIGRSKRVKRNIHKTRNSVRI